MSNDFYTADDILTGITRNYQKYVGSNPIFDTIWLTAFPAAVGYYGGKALGKGLKGALTKENEIDDEDLAPLRRRLALLGGIAGLGYSVFKHSGKEASEEKTVSLISNISKLVEKEALEDDEFLKPFKTVSAIRMTMKDPLLFDNNKDKVINILNTSNNNGMTSGNSIAKAAVKVGANFAGGYLLGQGFSRIFGLPPLLRSRLSTVGGVGAAVIGSGVLENIG